MKMNVFLIILGVILYLIIAWLIFRIASENDLFGEFSKPQMFKFPTQTFTFSIFWIITIICFIICAIFGWIAEEIETWGYAYYESKRIKKREERLQDNIKKRGQ